MKLMRWVMVAMTGIILCWALPVQAGVRIGYKHSVRGWRTFYPWYVFYTNRTGAPGFYFDIERGDTSFTVDTGYDGHGGRGNCDLYVRFGAVPTASQYTRRSTAAGYRERITVNNPPRGRWYVRLHARRDYKTCSRIIIRRSGTSGTWQVPSTWRSDMLGRLNYYRARVLGPLGGANTSWTQVSMSATLQNAAQKYVNDQAAGHRWDDTPGYRINRILEAVGYLGTHQDIPAHNRYSVASVMNYWLNHPNYKYTMKGVDKKFVGFGCRYSTDLYGPRWVMSLGTTSR